MIEISRYSPVQSQQWNQFVAESKNGTFLFDRRYMDYHCDRFEDMSFCFYKKHNLSAVLPANIVGDTLYSHAGLTYGGLICNHKMTATDVCECFDLLRDELRERGVKRVVYKPVPHIYHRYPSEEDLYALNECKGTTLRLQERDITSVVPLSSPISFSMLRRRGVKKAQQLSLVTNESDDLKAFWDILSSNLEAKYNAKPIHTFEEIDKLKNAFPENIRLFAVFTDKGQMLGGTLLYCSERVIKTQYISANEQGKACGALDLLFHHIINKTQWNQTYLDLGTSALNHTSELNTSLLFQKEGFGGRCVCYDCYEWIL